MNVNSNDIIENNCSKKYDEENNKRSEVKVMINNKLVYSNSIGTNLYQYSNNLLDWNELAKDVFPEPFVPNINNFL